MMLLALLACGPSTSKEDALSAAQSALSAANPTSGRVGVFLKGKTEWVQGPMFDRDCIAQKQLAFPDKISERPSGSEARISATYSAQRFITTATPEGLCLLLGNDGVKVTLGDPTVVDGAWVVPVNLDVGSGNEWASCIMQEYKARTLTVRDGAEGQPPTVEGDLVFLKGGCPSPMPEGEIRKGAPRPTERPPRAPSRDEVLALMKSFDKALYDFDFTKAHSLTSCYNLVETSGDKYGACTPAEFVLLGPHPTGEARIGDGNDWLELVIRSMDDIGAIVPDGKIPTMYHVKMKHKRDGRPRSFAVEWVGGEWKLVAVVGRKGTDLTTARIVYDLDDSKRKDIFLRRLAGENLDESGEVPLRNDDPEGQQY